MLTRPIVALAALALTASAACAGPFDADLAEARALACPAGGRLGAGQPILGSLPISPLAGDRTKAAFALPYARLISVLDDPPDLRLDPPGFFRGPDSQALFAAVDHGARAQAAMSGFYAATFFHCSANAIVIAYQSTNQWDPRDDVIGLIRLLTGGQSRLALRFADAVAAAFPGYAIALVGHSSGGALASYAAGIRQLPSIVFNPARSVAATTNTGAQQLVIIVRGDPIADPDHPLAPIFGGGRSLSGATLWLDVDVEHPLVNAHQMSTVIVGLTRLL